MGEGGKDAVDPASNLAFGAFDLVRTPIGVTITHQNRVEGSGRDVAAGPGVQAKRWRRQGGVGVSLPGRWPRRETCAAGRFRVQARRERGARTGTGTAAP